MGWTEIRDEADIKKALDLFDGGAKLVAVSYVACDKASDTNNIKSAVLEFKGKNEFSLKFELVECLHIVPIAMGSIYLSDVALGAFGRLRFFADDGSFDPSEPDSSLTYVVAGKIYVNIK